MEHDSEPLTYSVGETRKLLGISRTLVYQAIRTGQIPSIRIGRRILIPRLSLEQWLDGTGKYKGSDRENLH